MKFLLRHIARVRALVVCLCVALPAQAFAHEAAAAPVVVDGAGEVVLKAKETGRRFRILVWQPPGAVPEKGFPVIYALDGDINFTLLVSHAEGLAPAARRAGRVPPIIVGIGYPDREGDINRRTFDMTPPAETYHMPERPNGQPWPPLGGGLKMLDFLTDDLKPYIHANYPVDGEAEVLFGHSLGGLMTLYTLLLRPEAFTGYVASSPSLWFNEGQLIGEMQRFAAGEGETIPLLLTVGGSEEEIGPWERASDMDLDARMAWVKANRMVGNARDLAAGLKEGGSRVALRYEKLPGEDHRSAKAISSFRAVEFAIDLAAETGMR